MSNSLSPVIPCPPATLVLDVGTLSTRAILFDAKGQIVFHESSSLEIVRDGQLRVEQDGEQLATATQRLADAALRFAMTRFHVIQAALTTQRSSVVAWRRQTGEPLSPVLSWQDRRERDWLASQPWPAAEWLERTGLPLSPHYGASKLRWLWRELHEVADCSESSSPLSSDTCARTLRDTCAGPLAAFLVQRLTAEATCAVDVTNAARMQLVELSRPYDWSDALLSRFELPRGWLPHVQASRSEFGHLKTTGDKRVPLRLVCGDQQAAFHSLRLAPGTGLVNLGTGAFIMLHGTHPAPTGLLCSPGPLGETIVEGTVNGAGAALEWAAHLLGVDSQRLPWDLWQHQPPPTCRFVNLVGGSGSPRWIPAGESFWTDEAGTRLVQPPTCDDAMLAVLESIAERVAENVTALRAGGLAVHQLVATGGLASIDRLRTRLGELCACTIEQANMQEATAVGAWRLLTEPVRTKHEARGHSSELTSSRTLSTARSDDST